MTTLNKASAAVVIFISAILLLSIGNCIAFPQIEPVAVSSSGTQPFYVGVTYCGNSVAQAKQLIDKVKDYTNLFILQSGVLQNDTNAVNNVGDYVIKSDMNFIVYFGTDSSWLMKTWLDTYDGRWGDHFLGVYFGDEPGGKMLDSEANLYDQQSQSLLRKLADGTISSSKVDSDVSVTYKPDGTIITTPSNAPEYASIISDTPPENFSFTTYYPDGKITITTQERGSSQRVEDVSNSPYSYEQLWNARPFQSYDETARIFVDEFDSQIGRATRYNSQFKFKVFTSDYALYWFDYLAGYDVVFAQFGWNQSTVQDIALARGAASMQNKSWGAIITWKYTQPPYLASKGEIYEEMRIAYESGAQYIVIFNYAENMQNFYGTLKEEHFQALERFWNEEVQNHAVVNGETKAEAVLVLPKNYGWGMRSPEDKIWGLWNADEKSEQIWTLLGNLIQQYGLNLDIVYNDATFPVTGKYDQIVYTYTDKTETFPTTFVVSATATVIVAFTSIGLLVYFKKRKH